MNLQVNLIRPQELRSASLVSLKSLGLIAGIIVPLVLLLCIGWAYMGSLEARSVLKMREQERIQAEPQQKEAVSLAKHLSKQKARYDELMGWNRSRIPWNNLLEDVRPHIPDSMQWRTLQMRTRMTVASNGVLSRESSATLIGRCKGMDAEAQVETLRRAWETEPSMTQWVAQATVTSFREDDTPGAAKEDRHFQIDVKFRPGRFHAITGK